MLTPYYDQDGITVYHGRCEDVLPTVDESSIDLIVVDPPYFKVKGEWWDRKWDTPAQFLAWIGQLCDEWRRVLKPNGSLYCFASPQMAWGVEGEIRQRFNVLNQIRWMKDAGWHNRTDEGGLRCFLNPWESISFAEQFNSDNHASGETNYTSKCDELRGFVFEPLRAYIAGEFERAGMLNQEGKIAANVACGFSPDSGGMAARHYFGTSQWFLPTEQHYNSMRQLLNGNGTDHLRREYEDLRREYEDLRRPFNASEDKPYTDVWRFPTVSSYQGKHACEKPAELLDHIMAMSGREGCKVLDCFAGSGSTLIAAKDSGYESIGIEIEEKWVRESLRNIARGFTYNAPDRVSRVAPMTGQGVLEFTS